MKPAWAWLSRAGVLALVACASSSLPLPPRPDSPLTRPTPVSAARAFSLPVAAAESATLLPSVSDPTSAAVDPVEPVALSIAPSVAPPSPAASDEIPLAPDAPIPAPAPPPVSPTPPSPTERCASVPPLLPNGAVPPAPPHTPKGEDVEVPGDRPAYVLGGDPGDPRVIVYLPGMCGDATAADYFREAVRAHGTLIAVRGDTLCDNGRFKWRDDPSKIQQRVRAAFERVNAQRGGSLDLGQALLFGYSQGADRAEKLAAAYPERYPRVVLGGPPLKPSPRKLARAKRVVVLGGELETTENMRAGFEALQSAGISARWFTLECAYHGYFGTSAEAQLGDVLDWVSQN